ncbi:MAG: YfhO family protein [Lachnospiraceae bacterium]|nr:YfhO family protein [Lachnospiraceae bacterium]
MEELRANEEIHENTESPRRRRSKPLTRPGDGLLISFLVPVVIMIIIFIQRGIFPFGDDSFLRTDMYHQYAPFFSEFQYKLRNGGSLLYSWDIGMGVNFAALYAYYLASPFNWLLFLCPKAYIIEFMTYMIVLKVGLSGLSFAWYLRKRCRTNTVGVGFFGIFYALSGYMAAYSWNIMWLDCIILFPLIVYGLECLVKRENGFLYCVTLGLSILSNYYISIMTCIFMVLYFFALLIMEKRGPVKKYVKACARFGLYSLLAGALAAFVLLPEIAVLRTTASGDISFPKTLTSYFPIFDMLARHIACVETEIGLDHWPNLYCGVAVLMFFLLYLASGKISVKEKSVYCGLLLIFFASFSVNALNFMWHGFHYPNSLPCRQSFIYIFLMLFVCFRAFQYLDRTPRRHVAAAYWGSICFVILAEKLVEQEHFHFSVYYVAILFLSAYAGLIYLFRQGKRTTAGFLALAVISIEASVNMTVTSVPTTSREVYTRDNKEVQILMKQLEPAEDFYRVEKKTRKTKNDGAWMNFPSVSLFSSTADAGLTAFFKRIGCEASTNAYSITGSTPLVDSILSVKYALYSEEVPNTDLTSYMKESGGTYLYENLYTLPLGFVVPADLEEEWQYKMERPAEVQNDFCEALGVNDVLYRTAGTVSGSTYQFTPDIPGEYYAYVVNKSVKTVKASLPSGSKTFNNVDRGYLLELGRLSGGEKVTLTAEDKGEQMNVEVYRFSDTAMTALYDRLNESPLHLTSWTDTELSGTVKVKESGVLFTSIPFDKGWTVTIDGNEAETKKIFEAFLSVDIPEGTHEITFRYFPGGLKTGAVISAAAAGILLLIYIGKKRYGRRPKRIRMPAATEGSGAANTEENTAKGGLDYETLGRTLHKRDE